MTDMSRPSPTGPASGVRWGVISVLVAIAFLAGLVLAGYLLRHGRWLNDDPAVMTPDPAASVAAPSVAPAAPPAADPAALSSREAVLAAQLAALEARTAAVTVDADTAGGEAARAEALLVTVAVRRALDRGVALGYLDAELHARFGAARPRAVAAIVDAAHTPRVTLEDLRQGLDAIGPALTTGVNRGWWQAGVNELATLVVVRRADTPSPLPADRLDDAQRLLAAGQVEAARAEVARLPGAAAAPNWMAAARRYALARQALDVLENAALQGQAGSGAGLAGPAPVTPTAR